MDIMTNAGLTEVLRVWGELYRHERSGACRLACAALVTSYVDAGGQGFEIDDEQ